MKKVEYSQIARRKLKALKIRLSAEFGVETSERSIKHILDAVRGLEAFPEKGVSVSALYNIDCGYRYLYVKHNYLFCRIEEERIVIVEIFDEREDFMYKLFGLSSDPGNSSDHWNE